MTTNQKPTTRSKSGKRAPAIGVQPEQQKPTTESAAPRLTPNIEGVFIGSVFDQQGYPLRSGAFSLRHKINYSEAPYRPKKPAVAVLPTSDYAQANADLFSFKLDLGALFGYSVPPVTVWQSDVNFLHDRDDIVCAAPFAGYKGKIKTFYIADEFGKLQVVGSIFVFVEWHVLTDTNVLIERTQDGALSYFVRHNELLPTQRPALMCNLLHAIQYAVRLDTAAAEQQIACATQYHLSAIKSIRDVTVSGKAVSDRDGHNEDYLSRFNFDNRRIAAPKD